ncbi:alpha/beta hydrolase [Kitasatospora sp. NPDC007106]|uniref:alpha/beta fold hydrolase n=1 Tax=Kitasatospora sp. NPDC007106 TaxID=3156914 RepID=UPI0033D1F7F4
MTDHQLALPDGRTLRHYDTGPADAPLTVVWHHGTPNLGTPPAPLLPAAARLGIRFVSYDRPGYGGSTPLPGRDVASAAADTAALADSLGIERFAVLGHSGGGPHALACAALLPDRVLAAASVAGLAPYGADGLDWYAGMTDSGVASLRAAAAGRAAKERHQRDHGADYDCEFTPGDLAALHGVWSWFDTVVGPAVAAGPAALIDDDLAYTAPWGFDPGRIRTPVLLVHGERDRIVPAAHSRWLADRIPTADLRTRPDDGHISVLTTAEDTLTRLAARATP